MARTESSIVSVSWIPREAIEGLPRLPFDMGVTHYDMPPPDEISDLKSLLESGSIRFANELRAWIEVEDGRVKDYGSAGRGHMGITTVRFGPLGIRFPAIAFPDLRPPPEMRPGSVRFVQTAGGRPPLPAPRRLHGRPYVHILGPTVWSTLSLTIRADGTSDYGVVGASSFPRHWIYDDAGKLVAKIGVIDFDTWYRESFGEHTPWGGYESPALVTAVESALERELSLLMIASRPQFRKLSGGDELVRQGDVGKELFLVFDGVIRVEKDGETIAEVGPGAILGEMALLQGGRRAATLRAVTSCRVAIVPEDVVDKDALARIAADRKEEEHE